MGKLEQAMDDLRKNLRKKPSSLYRVRSPQADGHSVYLDRDIAEEKASRYAGKSPEQLNRRWKAEDSAKALFGGRKEKPPKLAFMIPKFPHYTKESLN